MAMLARNRLIGGTYHRKKAYLSGSCKGISPQNMAKNMVLIYTSIYSKDLEITIEMIIISDEKSWTPGGHGLDAGELELGCESWRSQIRK